jgi:hypothetical protein
MADMNNLISVLGEAIAADTGISAWCDTNYDTTLTVYENCDSREDPPADVCPFVIVWPLEKHAGMALKDKQHGVGVSVVVYDENKATSDNGVVRFTGGRNVEALRQLVLAVVKDKAPSGLHLMNVDTMYETIDQFPFASANMALIFEQKWTIGSNPFE